MKNFDDIDMSPNAPIYAMSAAFLALLVKSLQEHSRTKSPICNVHLLSDSVFEREFRMEQQRRRRSRGRIGRGN